MAMIRFKSKIEQVAAHLREEMMHGRWGDQIPGRHELAAELGINSKTVEEALRLLVRQKLLEPQGAGRRRRIIRSGDIKPHSLRVAVLDFEPLTRGENYMVDLMHKLTDAGHVAFSAKKSLLELGMNVGRVAKLVEATPADAWLICGGSHGVLEWFTRQRIPAFALFGRRRNLPIAGAGPDKPPAIRELARRLLNLGHRRIVMLVREERRLPHPGVTERAFLETLESFGITPGPYHMPEWVENLDGFHRCLVELFRLTPPTAIIVDEAPCFTAAMQFCTRRGMSVPEDVSLACCDWNPNFSWCRPAITHIGWDSRQVVRRIVRWANNTSLGCEDLRQTNTLSKFIEGGTIGPVKR